jgi:hypothetical protein
MKELDIPGAQVPNYTPRKFPTSRGRRLNVLFFKKLRKIPFHLVEVVFATKPSQKF